MRVTKSWVALVAGAVLQWAPGYALADAVVGNVGTLAVAVSFTCVTEGCDTTADAWSALSTLNVDASSGGGGLNAASVSRGSWPTPESASGSVALTGGLAVPTLKAGAASASLRWVGGAALGVQRYTYSGSVDTLSLTWNLTGSITNPDGDDTTGLAVYAAFVDGAALDDFPDLSTADPLAVALFLATLADGLPTDDVRQLNATDDAVTESGTIDFDVTDGQEFYLLMGLLAGAGGQNAVAESLSTLTAQFAGSPALTPTLQPTGNGIPLPATAAMALLGLALLARTQRRR
jgi:MYXO-CTERM domain-containing protein